MPRFLRINKTVVHVPSLANVNITTDCYGYPVLCLHYHTHTVQRLRCGKYEECEKQMMRFKKAIKEIETELEGIPLVEPVAEATIEPTAVLNEVAMKGVAATV